MATRLTLPLDPSNHHLFGSRSHCFLVVANNLNSLKDVLLTKLGVSL